MNISTDAGLVYSLMQVCNSKKSMRIFFPMGIRVIPVPVYVHCCSFPFWFPSLSFIPIPWDSISVGNPIPVVISSVHLMPQTAYTGVKMASKKVTSAVAKEHLEDLWSVTGGKPCSCVWVQQSLKKLWIFEARACIGLQKNLDFINKNVRLD